MATSSTLSVNGTSSGKGSKLVPVLPCGCDLRRPWSHFSLISLIPLGSDVLAQNGGDTISQTVKCSEQDLGHPYFFRVGHKCSEDRGLNQVS